MSKTHKPRVIKGKFSVLSDKLSKADMRGKFQRFADRARDIATSDNAKLTYAGTAFVGVILGIHAAQCAITKRILLS